ncbi:MAG: hypothetical protein Q9227_005858 [Pyrenula ochraceoflavens]
MADIPLSNTNDLPRVENDHPNLISQAAEQVDATTPDTAIRILSTKEYREAALCLAEAFATDHVVRYPIDTPDRENWTNEQKWNLHLAAMEYVTYAHCLKGLVTTIGSNYDSVALWMPPGKNMDDFFTIMRSGLWRLKFSLSAEGKKRFFHEFLPLLHKSKQEVLENRDDDSWYLVYIGTKPASRGKGYCRRLIEHVTSRADAENRACYLESSNDINPAIYQKLGFRITKQIALKPAGQQEIRMDCMLREPVAPDQRILPEKGKL